VPGCDTDDGGDLKAASVHTLQRLRGEHGHTLPVTQLVSRWSHTERAWWPGWFMIAMRMVSMVMCSLSRMELWQRWPAQH
jgi:hypothetical protein